MYYIFSVLTGLLITVMVVVNGELTVQYGLYSATVVIHFVGLLFASILLITNRKRVLPSKKLPIYYYLGGAFGVVSVVFNNLAFGKISVSAILGLGLLGQCIISFIIDQLGLFKMPKRSFSKKKISGLIFVLLGIAIMLEFNNWTLLPIIISFITGFTVVMSRIINGRLAQETSVLQSTFYNYGVGITLSIIVLLTLGSNEPHISQVAFSPRVWIYFGGLLGVCVVMLSNIVVTKISSFYVSLLMFIGQVFSGVVIDIMLTQSFSLNNLIGGILITAGLSINLWIDRATKKQTMNQNPQEKLQRITHIDNDKQSPKPDVIFETRPANGIFCPHCWTKQRSNRKFCYRCSAKFIYLDEIDHTAKPKYVR